MTKRWYDKEPTLSMAVSLLQNAPKTHQERVASYMLRYLEREGVLAQYGLEKDKLAFLFPLVRRVKLDTSAWELLEILKRLPQGTQIEIALNMINYIYLLDAGLYSEEEEAQLEAENRAEEMQTQEQAVGCHSLEAQRRL